MDWLPKTTGSRPTPNDITSQPNIHWSLGLLNSPIDPRAISPSNPHFVPLPGTKPIPVWAALLPPLTYLLALSLLPPPQLSKPLHLVVTVSRFALAVISIISFTVLPFVYHVPGSAVLTYQLGLVGCYGACRVFDIFFLSYPRVPRRLTLQSENKPTGRLYPHTSNEQWPTQPHPIGIKARLWWALDLMISMRGVGWDYASPDVRHDTNPWQPPSRRQLRRALVKIGPVLAVCLLGLRIMTTSIDLKVHPESASDHQVTRMSITNLPAPLRPFFVAFTGISLYALFDFGYTVVSAAALPIFNTISQIQGPHHSNHNVDFFPLLYPVHISEIRSVRNFWSKAWHRLFHRAFLIYGILPFQGIAIGIEYFIKLFYSQAVGSSRPRSPFGGSPQGKPNPSRHADPGRVLTKGQGDWGKVMGAFIASGIIHAISERAALGGRLALPPQHLLSVKGWQEVNDDQTGHDGMMKPIWSGVWSATRLLPPFSGSGELTFFLINGAAVVAESIVGRVVVARRKDKLKRKLSECGGSSVSQSEEAEVASSLKVSSVRGNDGVFSSTSSSSSPNFSRLFGTGSMLVKPTQGTLPSPRRTSYGNKKIEKKGPSTSSSNSSSSDDVEIKKQGVTTPLRKKRKEIDIHDPSVATYLETHHELKRWYDVYFQLAWTLAILLTSGELFVEGWLASGVINELTFVKRSP